MNGYLIFSGIVNIIYEQSLKTFLTSHDQFSSISFSFSLEKRRFLSTVSKAFLKSMKHRNVSLPLSLLFLSILQRTNRWSMQDRPDLNPFCSSASKLCCSRNFWSLVLRSLEYTLATQHIKVMQRLCKVSRGSLSLKIYPILYKAAETTIDQ